MEGNNILKKKQQKQQKLKRQKPTNQSKPTTEIKYRKKPRPIMGYFILNIVLSTFIFIFIYFGYLLPLYTGVALFGSIILANIIAGIFGSMLARMLTSHFSKMGKTNQKINQILISAVIYAICVYFGFYTMLLDRYVDINSLTVFEFFLYMFSMDFIEAMIILMALKFGVYLLSDFASDKFSFGG